ncbi:MAG: hypothetical protein ACYDEY_06090 [Acidimicrobiales bacterium]
MSAGDVSKRAVRGSTAYVPNYNYCQYEFEEYANDFCLPGTNACVVSDDDNEVGGASGEPDSEPDFDADRADTFNNYLQAYVNGGWEYWPSMQTVVNAGCNAFAEGFCLNGSEVQTYEWADNKPT